MTEPEGCRLKGKAITNAMYLNAVQRFSKTRSNNCNKRAEMTDNTSYCYYSTGQYIKVYLNTVM